MLKHLVRKEFLQILRDRKMVGIVLVAPIFQLMVFGYAANLDVVEVSMVVCDMDHSIQSKALIERFEGSSTFQPISNVEKPRELNPLMTRGAVAVALVIPKGYGETVGAGESASVQVIVDGTNSVNASAGLNGALMIVGQHSLQLLEEKLVTAGFRLPEPVNVEPRVWYNPDLKSRNYFVPGILGLLLMVMTLMLTSMAVVKEKEVGTLEQLIVTPIRPIQLILGKLLPFVAIGLVQITVVFLVALFWFQVPFRGSLALLYLMSFPFLLNTLGIGLLISTLASNQQQAMMMAMFFFMMPMIYFSGFVFPIDSMPYWVQPVCYLVPLTYFLNIVRGLFLRGVGLEVLWVDVLALCGIGTAVLGLAAARFRKTLD